MGSISWDGKNLIMGLIKKGRGGAATTQGISLAILSKILHVSIFQKKCRQNSIRKIKKKNSIAFPPDFLQLLPF
jgi:hypothetical protein